MSIGSLLRRVKSSGRMTPTSNLSSATVLAPGAGTPRTLGERAGDVVNVLDFIPQNLHAGIRARTGTTPLHSYFQTAVDALTTLGGTLYMPRGAYVFGASLSWRTGVSLRGDGPGKSVIKSVGSLFSAIRQTTAGPTGGGDPDIAPLEDCTFADFEIDASGLTSPDPAVDGKGLFILYMRRARFLNLYIHDTIGTGLGCDFLDDSVIDGVVVKRAGRNFTGSGVTVGQSGIGIGSGWRTVESLTVTNCHTTDCGNYGIFFETQQTEPASYRANGARVIGCYSEGNRYGFGNKGSGRFTIVASEARDNSSHGFLLNQNATENLVSACWALDNGGSGFAISGGTGDSVLSACISRGNSEYGAYVSGNVGGITLTGCKLVGNTKAGTRIEATSAAVRDIQIQGGEIARNGEEGILVSGGTLGIESYGFRGIAIRDNGQALTSGKRRGISMSGVVTGGKIAGNWIGNSVGASTQTEAVVSTGTTTDLDISGNTMLRHATGPIALSGTTSEITIRGNPGYNMLAPSVVTPGASPWAYTAGASVDAMLYLTGTDIQVVVGGDTVISGATHVTVVVPANQSATITYSTLTRAVVARL